MKKVNNKGFSTKEFMLMFAIIAILIAVGTKIVLDNTKSYGSFKTLANNFANSVAKYKDQVMIKEEYSLFEVESKGFIDEIKNPLDKKEVCDKFESFVEIPEISTKKVTLLCGKYLVTGTQNKSYEVYEVSNWSKEKKDEYNDNAVLYNFKLNGKLMLNEDVPARTFIQKYNEITGKNISSINEVRNNREVELVSNLAYREKKLLKELK